MWLSSAPPVDLRARRPAVRGHVVAHVALGENGHRRLGLRRRGNRILAPLDAVDGLRRPAPRLVGGEFPVPSKRRPLRPAGAARLDDVFLQARGIDPDAEAGEVPVPEYGVAMLDGQRVDGAFGDNPFLAVSAWRSKAFVQGVMEGMVTLSQCGRGPTERGFAIDFLITVTPWTNAFWRSRGSSFCRSDDP